MTKKMKWWAADLADDSRSSGSDSSTDGMPPEETTRRKRRRRSESEERRRRKSSRSSSCNTSRKEGNPIIMLTDVKELMRKQSEKFDGFNDDISEIRKQLEKHTESLKDQSKKLEKLIETLNDLSKQWLHTNVTPSGVDSTATRLQPNQVQLPRYRLIFKSGVSTSINIQKGQSLEISVALVDGNNDDGTVENGPLASATVELVVVNAEFNEYGNQYNWSRDDFVDNIKKRRQANSASGGVDQQVKSIVSNGRFNLVRGAKCHSGFTVFSNSSNKKVKLGVMVVSPLEERVLEGLSSAFYVRGHDRPNRQFKLGNSRSNRQRVHGVYQEQNGPMPNMQNSSVPCPSQGLNITGEQPHLQLLRNSTLLSSEPSATGFVQQEQVSTQQQYQFPHCPMLAEATNNQTDELSALVGFESNSNVMDRDHANGTSFFMNQTAFPVRLVWDRPNVEPSKRCWNLLDQFMPLYSCQPKFDNCALPTMRLMSMNFGSRTIVPKEMQTRRKSSVLIKPLEPGGSYEERPLRKLNSKYRLRFVNSPCESNYMMDPIKANDGSLLRVTMFDENNRKVTSGPLSSASVEIVPLHGDCSDHGQDYWTPGEFSRCIVFPQPGREASVLGGDCILVLANGEACLSDTFFQITSFCARTGKFKLGIMLASAQDERIQEGISEPFLVKHRPLAEENTVIDYSYQEPNPPVLTVQNPSSANVAQPEESRFNPATPTLQFPEHTVTEAFIQQAIPTSIGMDIATGPIGSILSKLANLLTSEYMPQTGVKDQVESLTKELQHVYGFLRKIAEVPPNQLDKQVKVWACEVREASYDMEDILDSFLMRVEDPAEPTSKKRMLVEMLQKFGSYFSKDKARHDISTKIEQVNCTVREIAERRQRYRLDDRVVSVAVPSSQIDPRIALVHRTNTSLLVGIDERKDAIIKMLSQDGDMSAKKTKIVSLLGFGGVGKTTLAQATYDQLKQEYECVAFVSVGQEPNLEKVFKDILYYLDKDKFRDIHSTKRDAALLIGELLDFLKDKRYLIVIDDIWETESRERILDALANNDLGSSIIITTRKSEVAIGEKYKVEPLSEDNSKRLFYTRIFGGEDKCHDNQQQKVSEVAEKILKKCSGVPLAIIIIASYLVDKSTEEWLEVCNSISFCGKDKRQTGDTERILSLSYYDLPPHLKTCLLYLSMFPEDHLISKHSLIWKWVAEGFVNHEKPGDGLFEIGEGYFNELINRSMIQPIEEENSMIVKGCRVHDMVLDFIRHLSHEENFVTVLDNGEEISKGGIARRLALQNRVVKNIPQDNCMNTKRARSFVTFRCSFAPRVNLRCFKLLRMLCLEDSNHVQLGEHFGHLHHLRYLGIRGDYDNSKLPKEIGALKFLRVLYLDHWKIGELLPLRMGMLTQLVCLYAPGMYLPGCTIKDLRALQELRICRLEGDDMSKGQFVKDLCNLSELRVLEVDCRYMDRRMESDFFTSVGSLHKLQHLDMRHEFNEGLPSCIHPSLLPKLSHLSLHLYSLSDQDLEILGGLPELSYLSVSTTGRATLTGTADRGYFRMLRSCFLPDSTVQFVVNDEDSSVSFTLWNFNTQAPVFGSKRKQDKCRVAQAVMPNLEALLFQVDLEGLTAYSNGSCDNLGLEYLASLQKVTVRHVRDSRAGAGAKKQEKAALRHTIQVHPNRPTLLLEDW